MLAHLASLARQAGPQAGRAVKAIDALGQGGSLDPASVWICQTRPTFALPRRGATAGRPTGACTSAVARPWRSRRRER